MGIPHLSFKALYHVGSLDPTQKGDQGRSMEGRGLSVSLHPEEWRKIAHLGTEPVWVLTKPNNRFLDFLKLGDQGIAQLRKWGEIAGLITMASIYRFCYYDDEMESEMCPEFETYEEAQEEADEWEVEAQEIPGRGMATDKLNKVAGYRVESSLVDDMLSIAFAETQGFDGVWWQEKIDPSRYSAPRGVIVPSKISSWNIQRNEQDEINEICRRAGLPIK